MPLHELRMRLGGGYESDQEGGSVTALLTLASSLAMTASSDVGAAAAPEFAGITMGCSSPGVLASIVVQ